MAKTRKNIIAILVVLAIFIAGTCITMAAKSNNGTIEVKELEFVTSETKTLVHGQLLIPENATAETPAPGVVLGHGGGDNLAQVLPLSYEFARRGYVVLAFDGSGAGETDVSPATDMIVSGTDIFANAVEQLINMDFVSPDIIVGGHSMGGWYSFNVANERNDGIIKLVLSVGMDAKSDSLVTNYAYILGKYDASGLNQAKNGIIRSIVDTERYKTLFDTDEDIVVGKEYGSWADGTGRIYLLSNTGHTWEMYDSLTINYALDIANRVVPNPNYIEPGNQTWGWVMVGEGMAFLSILAFVFFMASLLLKTAAFEKLALPVRKPVGFKTKSAPWFLCLALMTCISPVLYFVVTPFMRNNAPSWMHLNFSADGMVFWHWVMAAIYITMFLVFHFVYAKRHGGCLMTYGLATEAEENRINIKYVLCALLFAAVVFLSTYLLLTVFYNLTHHSISFMKWKMGFIPNYKIGTFLLYFVLELPYLFTSGLASRSLNVNNGDRRKGASMRRSVALSLAISSIGLIVADIVLTIVVTTSGKIIVPQVTFYTGLLSMLPWLAISGLVNCYLTNKTNSTYTGVFCATLISAWSLAGNFPIA